MTPKTKGRVDWILWGVLSLLMFLSIYRHDFVEALFWAFLIFSSNVLEILRDIRTNTARTRYRVDL